MHKRYLLLLICCFNSLLLACDIETVKEILNQKTLQAEFKQLKTIKVLSRPLTSKGVIWKTVDSTIIWQTQQPFVSTLVLSQSNILRFNNKHQLKAASTQAKVKAIEQEMSQLFFNVFSGNLAELEKSFEQTLSCDAGLWSLVLTPKDEKLKNILLSISLKGASTLNSISFQEKRGDITDITLNHQAPIDTSKLEQFIER